MTPSGDLRLDEIPFQGNPTSPNNTTLPLQLNDDGSLSFGSWSSFLYPTNTIVPNQNINGTKLSVRTKDGTFRFNGKDLIFNSSYDGDSTYYTNVNGFQRLDDLGRVEQENSVAFITSDYGDKLQRMLKLDDNGNLRIYTFDSSSSKWNVVWQAVPELCRIKGTCGPSSICLYGEDYDSTVREC